MENNKFDSKADDSFNVDFTEDLTNKVSSAIDSAKDGLVDKASTLTGSLGASIEDANSKIEDAFKDIDTESTNTTVYDDLDLGFTDSKITKTDLSAESKDNISNTIQDSQNSSSNLGKITEPFNSTVEQLDALDIDNISDNNSPSAKSGFNSNIDLNQSKQLNESIDSLGNDKTIIPENTLTQENDLQTDSHSDPLESLLTDSFDETDIAGITSPRAENQLKNKNKSAMLLKVVAVALVLAIAAVVAFFFLSGDNSNQSSGLANSETTEPVSATISPAKPTENVENSAVVEPEGTDTDVVDSVSNGDESGNITEEANSSNTDTEVLNENSTVENQEEVLKSTLPDPEEIINAPIPTNDSQVKEEIDRLNDQDQQLIEQEKLLDKQVQMMDELTTKKEDQIELLEKQIAQLEELANKDDK